MIKILLAFVIAFVVGVAVAPFVIWIMKKQNAKQPILHYVEAHAKKQGTPTMGGFIFLVAIAVSCACLLRQGSHLALMCLVVTFAYALLGFLDDFIKIKFKHNMGLRPYQKIIFQFAIAVIVAIFVYKSPDVGSHVQIPFAKISVDFGYWIIPYVIIVFIACTNAVNLTDGLDGLASLSTFVYLIIFSALILLGEFFGTTIIDFGSNTEMFSLVIFAVATCGGLLAFLCFNAYPAKIFMGDTGSMALGAVVACLGIFSKSTLYIPLIGVVFVASGVSVCLQVAYYKKTKKRIFLMAPLHHHFEKKGVHETKIVTIYGVVTLVIGILTLLFEFL